MVKTRRSNGENGEVDEGNDVQNDVCVSDDKQTSNWTKRSSRSSQYRVKRKIQNWPAKFSKRLRTIKMPRIMFPESDTEPEKFRRKVRVFFTGKESTNRSVRIQRSNTHKNYIEDNEDKPIQQNVRRSCRKRKLLHHSFNESWITNEMKVRGYPGLYGLAATSSSDEESTSPDETIKPVKKIIRASNGPAITDEDTQSARQTRNSTKFNNSKKAIDGSGSESDEEMNKTVLENKEKKEEESEEKQSEDKDYVPVPLKSENDPERDSESNECPARPTRTRRRRQPKKEDSQTASDTESSDSGSDIVINHQPRRSNRTRKPKQAFVEIAPRQKPKTFTIRKKPYSLRERKPKILRRKNIRSQSPSSSSSQTSSDSEQDLNVSVKNKIKGRQKSKSMGETTERALRDIQPIELDGSVRFSSVGGLEEQIRCLREMVLFPLMYPDLFQKFKTRPAKGVLFHGPPGTGKTLLARALANECSLVGGRKVAFFMRKGADCLKKWVGESERHLKLLFQQANKMKPSIIFFDEIDALAPVRSVRQEQVHTSVVGTLLAEMDGLCDRGEVVVIGATNRLDAVDPALRRAGRFDRELHFPPPHVSARLDILQIYTRQWIPPPSNEMLSSIAQATNGYGGSDLKALCSEAVLKALRRVYPQVYESEHALLIDTKNVEVIHDDMLDAMHSLVACGARAAPAPAQALPPPLAPLLQAQLDAANQLLNALYRPQTERRLDYNSTSCSTLLLTGPCTETFLAPALLTTLEHCSIKELNMATLHSAYAFTPEQALISVFSECRRSDRGCVLYVRDVTSLWASLSAASSGAGASLLLQLWRTRAAGDNTLLLATSADHHNDLPQELQELFPVYKECTYRVREPTLMEVLNFLRPLFLEAPLEVPPIEHKEPPPPLPRAPPPPPPRETAEEVSRRKRKEDYKLRELRIFLRDICRKLASNRRFYKFTKPVDLEEVTDYLDIIKQPMDLETMMTKVDMHKYNCAKEFLDDIDLICANALEYNPDRTSSDKQIRHEACSLRDHAHALIEVEMDSDFEVECREIASKRRLEGDAPDADLPDFIYTASNLPEQLVASSSDVKVVRTPHNGEKLDSSQPNKRKRRRHNAWSKGSIVKRPKTQKNYKEHPFITDEESKENKPMTSTPLPNGGARQSSDDDSLSDDEPLVRPAHDPSDDHPLKLSSALLDSSTKSPERSSTKASPKKRNSGHDSGGDDDIQINKSELDNILLKNAKSLRHIGLETIIDLHSQISTLIQSYAHTRDRTKLPQQMQAIVTRYIEKS